MPSTKAEGQVARAASLSLKVDHMARWTYAANHREVIDAHWTMAVASNPNFFNGIVHVLTQLAWNGENVAATLMPVEFKTFLYWRDEGFPAEARVRDGFGSALIRSCEGHIVLGRQRPGNINEGLAYLPGGFIDPRDEGENGTVDIAGSIVRELAEETGLGVGEITAVPGFIVTQTGPHVSFAVVFNSQLTSNELSKRIEAHIASEQEPELAEPVVLRSPADMEGKAIAHYARVLLDSPLAWS